MFSAHWRYQLRKFLSLFIGSILLTSCGEDPRAELTETKIAADYSDSTPASELLKARSKEFDQEVLKLTDRVYTAVGFSVSPMSMIIGEEGVIIVDTGIHSDHSSLALEEFRKITTKPVAAIIFTHGHGDHTLGAISFVEKNSNVKIIASENYGIEAARNKDVGLNYQKRRGIRQSGFLLPKEKRINNGVAKAVWLKKQAFGANESNFTAPNHFVAGTSNLIIEGVEIEITENPGETSDQLMVWLPEEQVVFAGDNFYKSWPNLYAIRGTAYRDVRDWADSIASIRLKKAATLVGGHTRPIIGRENVEEVLTNYEEAIRYIFDQTISGMNQGLGPDELVQTIKLPEHLAKLDYLKPYYGHPEWAIRSIYDGYLGWFDGNPTNLFPLSPTNEAKKIAEISGGIDKLQISAHGSLRENPQWTAQLCDWILALEPNNEAAKKLKADALDLLGEQLLTATGRNYYFTYAQELRNSIEHE